jgi:hypothetical protein
MFILKHLNYIYGLNNCCYLGLYDFEKLFDIVLITYRSTNLNLDDHFFDKHYIFSQFYSQS